MPAGRIWKVEHPWILPKAMGYTWEKRFGYVASDSLGSPSLLRPSHIMYVGMTDN